MIAKAKSKAQSTASSRNSRIKKKEKKESLAYPSHKKNNRVLVCAAWPYVHAIPHFGNFMPFFSADALARFHRLIGDEVLFVSGSDEHGARMEFEAKKYGITPKQLVDENHAFVLKAIDYFGINFDNYSRTSSAPHHIFTKTFYEKVYQNGYISFKDEELPFCNKCGAFLPDKFVVGDCPHCGTKDIQGDQCDECGRVLDPLQLINPRCLQCGTKPVVRKSKTAYFDLPKLSEELKNYVQSKKNWQSRVQQFTLRWFEEGLQIRPITRDLHWGVPAPFPGLKDKVIYCWAEAVLGYVSAVAMLNKEKEYWKEPIKVSYFCLGKDNIPFHTILFPALLLAHGGYNLPDQIVSNEFLGFEGKQFSKSRGIGIWLDDVLGILPADYWRFYLFRIFPENKDTDFSWEDFEQKINSELVANLANYVNRVLTLINTHYKGKIPKEPIDAEIRTAISAAVTQYKEQIPALKIRDALDTMLALSAKGNEYLQRKEPWKNEKNRGCLASCALICKTLAVLLAPYLPETAQKMQRLFGLKKISFDDLYSVSGTVGKPEHLFNKINAREITAQIEEKRNSSVFQKLDLRVAKITEVKPHPKADKLYVLQIDVGEQDGKTLKKQIVAGMRPYYVVEDLQGRNIIIINNLQPAELRGIVSEGMLLAADDGNGKVGLLGAAQSHAGDFVFVEGIERRIEAKITLEDFHKLKLITHKGKVHFRDRVIRTAQEEISVDKNIGDGAQIR